jgi:hypothetical protein
VTKARCRQCAALARELRAAQLNATNAHQLAAEATAKLRGVLDLLTMARLSTVQRRRMVARINAGDGEVTFDDALDEGIYGRSVLLDIAADGKCGARRVADGTAYASWVFDRTKLEARKAAPASRAPRR